jgi:DNA polymerase III epsilon subunit-like protein
MIDKNNRKLKGTGSNLNARRLMFERMRSLWSDQRGVWCAVDFEAWDRDHRIITEFGWSMVSWNDGEPVEDMGHLIVAKHRPYRNVYIPEYRKFYHFGQSEDVTLKQLRDRIHDMIQSARKPGPLFLVFHDNHEDLKYLRSPEIEAPLEELSFFLPESCAEAEASDTNKIYVVDTSELFAALEGDSGGQKRSLERVCRLLQVKSEFTQHLHNAGNDARCTHLALKEMAGGDPLDMQRTARWPQHTSTNSGLRVKFSKEDEDSDALPSDDDDDELTAGPYDPRTGKLREGWAERVARLQERLDGIRAEQENPTVSGNGQPAET